MRIQFQLVFLTNSKIILKPSVLFTVILFRMSFKAKLDKIVAVLLFGFGIYCHVSVGWLWWTIIWSLLVAAKWFDLLTLNYLLTLDYWRTKIEFQRNPKFRQKYCLTFSRENIHFKAMSFDVAL